jgi:hypothetical protein
VAILPHPGGDVPGFSRLYFHGSEKAGKSIGSLTYMIIFSLKERLPGKRVVFLICTLTCDVYRGPEGDIAASIMDTANTR